MRAIGIGTSAVFAAVALGAAVLGVRSIPDIKRYLAMRRM
jgi:hypothetical protein